MAAKVEVQHIIVTAHRALKLAAQIPIVAGDIEVDAVTFEFEEEADWQDLSLLAYFTNSASGITEHAEYERGAELKIPQSVTQDVGYIGVALLGVDIDDTDPENPVFIQRAATQACPNLLRVYQSGIVVYDPDPQSPIAPTILEQYTQRLAAAIAATEKAEHSISQHNLPFVGADEDTAGDKGLVPVPAAGEQDLVLFGSGEWRDVNEVLDLDNKADIDGYYELLTAGAADNLTGRGDSVEGSFIYRTAGGDADIADGIATIECIKGNTVGWNQLVALVNNPGTKEGIDYVFNADGTITLNGTSTENTYTVIQTGTVIPLVDSHKYLYTGCPAGGANNTYHLSNAYTMSANYYDTGSGVIFTPNSTLDAGKFMVRVVIYSGVTASNLVFRPQLFDLTKIFGTGKEPATVAEFEALYPEPYYPYDAGTLKPVMFEGVETVGFNQWDEEWENGAIDHTTGNNTTNTSTIRSKNYIPVFPSTEYCYRIPNAGVYVHYYDADKNYLNYDASTVSPTNDIVFTTPQNARFVRFNTSLAYGGTYKGNININLRWSGYRDGEYEEYWKAQREIAIAQHFPTGMKAAGTAADMLYKDHADHVVGEVDLGTLNWEINTSGNNNLFKSTTRLSDAKPPADQTVVPNAKCSKYGVFKYSGNGSGQNDKRLMIIWGDSSYHHQIWIADSAYDDPADFKAAMSGVTLYYEKATPITEVIDPPLNLGYKVSDFGTERVMLADGVISAPPIFEISYGLNAVDTIRRLPTEYISHDSFEQFTSAMVTSFDVGITESWDSVNERYSYVITPSQTTTDADVMNIVNEEWEG